MDNFSLQYCIYNNSSNKRITLLPDEFDSRYKTRQLKIVINTTKKLTYFVNINDVAHDMQCDAEDILRFIGYTLSSPINYDKKKPVEQQAYVSGEKQPDDLSRLIEKFIEEIILCSKCRLPEIKLECNKDKLVQNCSACGCCDSIKIKNDKFEKYLLNKLKK